MLNKEKHARKVWAILKQKEGDVRTYRPHYTERIFHVSCTSETTFDMQIRQATFDAMQELGAWEANGDGGYTLVK